MSLRYLKMLLRGFWFCPLERQPSIALVLFAVDVVVTEAAFGMELLFQVGERAAGAAAG